MANVIVGGLTRLVDIPESKVCFHQTVHLKAKGIGSGIRCPVTDQQGWSPISRSSNGSVR